MEGDLLSIVIVSFNTRELLRNCLGSLVRNPNHRLLANPASFPRPDASGSVLLCEVTVVDNASKDGSAEMAAEEFPKVRVIPARRNLGFAGAGNLGLGESHGNLLMLLNPDTEVAGEALPTLASFLSASAKVAAVGPALIFPDGRRQHGAFRFPGLWMSLFDFFPLNHRLIDSPLNGRYSPSASRPLQVDHLLGAAMMVKRKAFEDVGPLDESFFMYCEEVDWFLRARRRGWETYLVPEAKVVHHGGQSTSQFREQMLVELHRSRYQLFRKHYSSGFIRGHRFITRMGLLKEAAQASYHRRRGKITQDQLASKLAAYRAIWEM